MNCFLACIGAAKLVAAQLRGTNFLEISKVDQEHVDRVGRKTSAPMVNSRISCCGSFLSATVLRESCTAEFCFTLSVVLYFLWSRAYSPCIFPDPSKCALRSSIMKAPLQAPLMAAFEKSPLFSAPFHEDTCCWDAAVLPSWRWNADLECHS